MDIVTGVGVLDKAVSIIDALQAGPRSLSRLAEATGLSRATAHRLAAALEAHGFLERDDAGRFAMGPRLAGASLATLARPAMERLRELTEESVQLYVRRGEERLCVAALESPHGLRTIVPVGGLLPIDRGSAGRVLQGAPGRWVESVEERQRGVASVSAAIRDRRGAVVAAISVSGPIDRTTRSPGARYGYAVAEAAAAVERSL